MTTAVAFSLILIVINCIVSYKGFKDNLFYDRYKFQVDKILIYKDYKRLVTSGFLHVSWMHLIFNMFSLYFFSTGLESYLGEWLFLLVYFASLIGGNLFSLYLYRKEGDYDSAGASGAIFGVMFASIALFPGMSIGLFIALPGWVYGLFFVLYSIYGIRSKTDNIGHEAHLGGGVIGMLIALAIQPSAFVANYFAILVILVPAIIFIYLIINKPHSLLIQNHFYNTHNYNYSIDDRYNASKKSTETEINLLLEKIHRKGINSLTKQEREKLERYSKTAS